MLKKGSPPPTCQLSYITCHVSCFTFHMSRVTCDIFYGQSGEAILWRVCYQRGQPRLVFNLSGQHSWLYLILFWALAKHSQAKSCGMLPAAPSMDNQLWFGASSNLTPRALRFQLPLWAEKIEPNSSCSSFTKKLSWKAPARALKKQIEPKSSSFNLNF